MSLELVNGQHGAHRTNAAPVPHLPAIARDVTDDAREVLAAFDAKQPGGSDVPYADLAEKMAPVLRALLAMVTRPAPKPVLRPLALLQVAQAEQFIADLAARSQGADLPAAMFLLGKAGRHLEALIDVVYATTRMPQ